MILATLVDCFAARVKAHGCASVSACDNGYCLNESATQPVSQPLNRKFDRVQPRFPG